MVTLKNKYLTVSILKKGAELNSIKYNDFEYIWEADPNVWGSSSPILFPICGGLKEDRYSYEGKEYILNKHGFVRREVFDVLEQSDDKVVFAYSSNEMTRLKYPFEFLFKAVFEIKDKDLFVTYSVKNIDKKDIYFSFGGHPAFACPEGIDAYDLVFEKKETLNAYKVIGNLLSKETDNIINDSDVLHLNDKLFVVDSLLFEKVNSKNVILKNRLNGRNVKFNFEGYDFLTVWTKPGAKYICLEPWTGTPDFIDTEYDITKKFGIKTLKPGEEYLRTFVIGL